MSEPTPLHPECVRMHAHDYCLCVTVQCLWCEVSHPPSKGCAVKMEAPAQKEKP